jgi:hypothetical protein
MNKKDLPFDPNQLCLNPFSMVRRSNMVEVLEVAHDAHPDPLLHLRIEGNSFGLRPAPEPRQLRLQLLGQRLISINPKM